MRFTAAHKKSLDIAVPFTGLAITGYVFIGKQKDRDIKYIIFVMLLVGIALWALTSAITRALLEKAINNLSTTAKAEIIAETKISSEQYERANTASIAIYKAFHSGWDEDESSAIAAVKTMSTPDDVKALSSIYQKKFNRSLRNDFEAYVKELWGIADWLAIPDYIKNSWY